MRKLMILVALAIVFGGGFRIDAASKIPDLKQAEWLLLGPFSFKNAANMWGAGYDQDYLTELGGERNAKPVFSQKTAGKKWLKVRAVDGQIDLGGVYGAQSYCVIYAYLEFNFERSETVALKLGSDDGVLIWFNNELLMTNNTIRPLQASDDAVRIQIKPGVNRLLMKVIQQTGPWGFAAQFRSMADENLASQKTKFRGFRICVNRHFNKPGSLNLLVSTLPALAVKEQVELTLSGQQGELLKRMTVLTGEPVKVSFPSNYRGLGRISVSGVGRKAGQKAETVVLIGDSKKIIKETIELARQTAAKISFKNKGEDMAATLTFLANQLEGKVHSSLSVPLRNIRAIELISDLTQMKNLTQSIGSRSGIRQWAYRSSIDGSCQPYTVYLPEGYSVKRKYHLLVYLHGYTGDDYNAVSSLVRDYYPDDFIIVAPFGRGDLAYASIGEQDVLDVVDLMLRTYSIDPDRVYLMGNSMGGCGAWRLGQFYSDRWAVVSPICGWTNTTYLTNLHNLPVFVVHGTADSSVPADFSQITVAYLKDLGYQARYDELPGVGHNALDAWIEKNGVSNLFEHLRHFKRNPWPERINLSVPYLRFGRHYWVRIEDSPDRDQPSQLSAQIIDDRHLSVNTANVTAFSLNLGHPKLAKNGRIIVNINGYYMPVDAGKEETLFTYSNDRGRFVNSKRPASLIARHEGGGLADLFTKPLYIVYGTKRRSKILRQATERLADWTINEVYPTGDKVGRFRVIADKDVTEKLLKNSSILCVGTISENALTSRLSKKIPVRFSKNSVEILGEKYNKTGFTLVYSNPYAPKRLVGIISLPFKEKDLMKFINRLNLGLRSYALDNGVGSFTTPDIAVYQAIDKVIWQGSFNNFWEELRAN